MYHYIVHNLPLAQSMCYDEVDSIMLMAMFELETMAENNVVKSFIQKQNGKSYIDPAIAQTTIPVRKYIDIIESSEKEDNEPQIKNKPYTKKQLNAISKKLKEEAEQSDRYTVAQSKKIEEIINKVKNENKKKNRKKRK